MIGILNEIYKHNKPRKAQESGFLRLAYDSSRVNLLINLADVNSAMVTDLIWHDINPLIEVAKSCGISSKEQTSEYFIEKTQPSTVSPRDSSTTTCLKKSGSVKDSDVLFDREFHTELPTAIGIGTFLIRDFLM